MSGLGTLLRTLGRERGVQIDDDELEALGLSDDELAEGDHGDQGLPTVGAHDDVLSETLPGQAAGMVEIFLAADSTATTPAVEKDDLMWYPIIREGQWAVRPGASGTKRRVPLKVVPGNSKNQRRQIGLKDIIDAFEDEAVQHVTVPSSHNNTTLENQGFIRKLKIVDGQVKNKITKKLQKVKILMGGYDITEPETKGKLSRGTIANRSAGLLYDYVNTETGKSYPVVLEHVALTNKPWITGMASFGRPLAEGGIQTVALSLADEDDGPTNDHEYALALSAEAQLSDEASDFLAEESADWSKEGSPSWLRQQVNNILGEARSKKIAAKRASKGSDLIYDVDYPPHYRCVEAKPGQALISDNWGDDSNFWAAPISVKDGAVELADFTEWKTLKKAFVPDERPAPTKDKLPLGDEPQGPGSKEPPKSRLQLAQETRRARGRSEAGNEDENPREVVEQQMADGNGSAQLSDLSPEAQRLIQAAEERAAAADRRAEQLSQRVDRLTGSVQTGETDQYIAWLRDPENGLGLTEERGFGGVLAEIRQLMLADDGEPALQGDHFATDGNSTGEISFSDGLRRIFGAFEKAQEGKKKIGEQLSEPADAEAAAAAAAANGGSGSGSGEGGSGGSGSGSSEPGTQAGESTPAGKPGSGEPEGETLSDEQRADKIAAESPAIAALTGRNSAPAGSSNGGSSGGDA